MCSREVLHTSFELRNTGAVSFGGTGKTGGTGMYSVSKDACVLGSYIF